MMAARDEGTSAAKRRREGRLRSWWRHEQMSIACAVSDALHHSSGDPKYDKRMVQVARHGAVRGEDCHQGTGGGGHAVLHLRRRGRARSTGEGAAAHHGVCRRAVSRRARAAVG